MIAALLSLTKTNECVFNSSFAYFPSFAMAPQDPPLDPLSFVGMRFLAAFAPCIHDDTLM
jgi:hypothetical protein